MKTTNYWNKRLMSAAKGCFLLSRSHRERLETGFGLLPRRLLAGFLSGTGLILLSVSLVFPPSANAHNIDLPKVREVIRDYARGVRAKSQTTAGPKYLHYTTNCVNAFPGHNHIVRCVVEYQNAADTAKGVYTCKEAIEIKMRPHDDRQLFLLFATHTSNACLNGSTLNDTQL